MDLSNHRLAGGILDELADLIHLSNPGIWGKDGLDRDYNVLHVSADHPNPVNPLHLFLAGKDPNWHLRQNLLNRVFPVSL